MKLEGWIGLSRTFLESPAFTNSQLWHVLSYCMLRANYRPAKIIFHGRELELKAGQFVTGRYAGARDCNMPPSTFWRKLLKLKKLRELDIESDRQKTIITLVKWGAAQCGDRSLDTGDDSGWTTSGHREEYNKEINIIYTRIFDYWNGKNLVKHPRLTHKMTNAIKAALKDFAPGMIARAIHNYSVIVNSDEYYFSYRWTLGEFLIHGVEKFSDLKTAKNNYRRNDFTRNNIEGSNPRLLS